MVWITLFMWNNFQIAVINIIDVNSNNVQGNQNRRFGPIAFVLLGQGMTTSGSLVPIQFIPVSVIEWSEKFDGSNLKIWQQKIFYFTSLQMHLLLKEDPPMVHENVVDVSLQLAVTGWRHVNFMCQIRILKGRMPHLYEVYYMKAATKKLIFGPKVSHQRCLDKHASCGTVTQLQDGGFQICGNVGLVLKSARRN